MESPHEHQQNLLLSRIITNVEKLNESIVVMNKSLQEINVQNMNIELVAQMFKNYQSNVLFHLEGVSLTGSIFCDQDNQLIDQSYGQSEGAIVRNRAMGCSMA